MSSDTTSGRLTIVGRLSRALNVVAGLCLLALVLLLVGSVFSRYVLHQPMLGANEILQLVSLGVVVAALPYCTATNGHVGVDVLDPFIGRWGRLFGDVMSRLIGIFVLGALVLRGWDKMLDAREYDDATNMLNLLLWPYYGLLTLGVALCAVVMLDQLVQLFKRGGAA